MAGSHSDPNAPEPKPTIVRKDLVPLKRSERIASGIIAGVIAAGLVVYITAIRMVDQAAPECVQSVTPNCVVTVNQLPDPAISLGLLAVALVFSLFAATGYVWSIKTSIFEGTPTTKDAEVLPNDAPPVQEAASLVKETASERTVMLGRSYLNVIDPDNYVYARPTLGELREIVPDDLWDKAQAKWGTLYPGSSLLSAVRNVKGKLESANQPGYFIVQAVSPTNELVSLKLER